MLAGDLANKARITVTNPNIDLKGITENSSEVVKGFIFAALHGVKANGEDFISDALSKGASAVLLGTDSALLANKGFLQSFPVPVFIADNPRQALSLLLACFYPLAPSTITAVTGTNGKTSTSVFCRQIWEQAGLSSASMGTIGIVSKSFNEEGNLTSPPPTILYRNVNKLAALGITNLAIEASSHGICQNRLDGLKIKAAGFTNLTRDHLDYHKTMENYFQAKLRLFTELLDKDGTAVINADIPETEALIKAIRKQGIKVLTYGFKGKDLKIAAHRSDSFGQNLLLEVLGKTYNIRLPLAGDFQAENALCAAGLAIATGITPDNTVAALEHLKGAWGRLENVVNLSNKSSVYVDYAHTPDAIENVLKALRPITKGKLHILFGCGGDRDRGKRPQMGKIAAELADNVIVTDDNPRTEDAAFIRSEIMPACPDATEIADRAEAIRFAVSRLQTGDVLVLAGKGHETGQKIGNKVFHFNDTEEAIKAAIALDSNAITGQMPNDSIIWSASELAHLTGGAGKAALSQDFGIYGIKTDIKNIKVGDAYLSMTDNENDIQAAFKKGARAAIVQKPIGTDMSLFIIVDNTETALDIMARHKRNALRGKVLAVFKSASASALTACLNKAFTVIGNTEIIKDKSGNTDEVKLALANLKNDTVFVITEFNNLNTASLQSISATAKPDVIVIQAEDRILDIGNVFKGANAGSLLFLDSAREDFAKLEETAKLCGMRKVIPYRFGKDKAKHLCDLIINELSV